VAVATTTVIAVLAAAGVIYFNLSREQRIQSLPDGGKLVLTRLKYGTRNEFKHGKPWEKLLGDLIPTNGIGIAGLRLRRPNHDPVFTYGKPKLVAEFKLRIGPNKAGNHPLIDSRGPCCRCIISGADGVGYAESLWPNQFRAYRDGYFGYVLSSRFPRDSEWLHLRIDQREPPQGPWHAVASFTIKNPTRPANLPWVAHVPSIMTTTNGMEFALGEVTVETQSVSESEFTNAPVLLPFRVRTNGLALTNWAAVDIEAEDATGNWDHLVSVPEPSRDWTPRRVWRLLDARAVWKLEVDFSPQADFAPENQFTLQAPLNLPRPFTTNFLGVPLEVSWVNQTMLAVAMPTNITNMRLLFIKARNGEGRDLNRWAGSWAQFHFWRMLDLSQAGDAVEATVAVVPNVHATYLIQPKLVPSSGTNR
jgi:hypothetical protein